ncbi:bifunctional diguanylate cyclase/phosphodiesterase [Thioalbus denitrificans]|uniref:Diguanylate cyclase (GGDEF)-like protein n=1 Tax=Thioalbus denitrificans TaxID=547122 RepID=A0A369CHN9_9GAMM|nr:EAL domain-containing protein [Thioalbus denitrificans]RCX32186.1 diguanylate cyclase (GGDEF)-like protein [Thioalbus denitrificans]
MRLDRFLNLRTHLILLVLVVLGPSYGYLLVFSYEAREHARADARLEAVQLSRFVGAGFTAVVGSAQRLLEGLALTADEEFTERDSCTEVLARLLTGQSDRRYANLGLIQADGALFCSAVPAPGPVNLADRTYFQRALKTRRFVVGDFIVGRITGIPVLAVAQPMFGPKGRIQGVLYASIDLHWLSSQFLGVSLPAAATIDLVGGNGMVLAHYPDASERLGKPLPVPGLARRIQQVDPQGTIEAVEPAGQARLYAYTRLYDLPDSHDLVAVVSVSADSAYAVAADQFQRQIIALFIISVVALVGAWALGHYLILSRTRALVGAAQRLGGGDFGARSGLRPGRDELGQIAASFDGMAAALEARERSEREHLQRIARLNRIHRVLSGINGAIVRLRDQDALLAEACRVAVEQGGYLHAWVALQREERLRLAVAVHAVGAEVEGAGLEGLIGTELARPDNPFAQVARSRRAIVCGGPASSDAKAAFAPFTTRCDYPVQACLPLRVEGGAFGVLVLHGAALHLVEEEESRLLQEFAADISLGMEHAEKERRIAWLSYYDRLTGLPNEHLFQDRLQMALQACEREDTFLALMIINIVNLRRINDDLGHGGGDQVLLAVRDRLCETLRGEDTLAHLGGGEFGVMLAGLQSGDEAQHAVGRILAAFPLAMTYGQAQVQVPLRAGIALYPLDGDSPALLQQRAALALHALAAERNSVETRRFFSPGLDRAAQEHRRLRQALARAQEQEELFLHYQPVVDLASGRMVGAEALLRWESGELGAVSPARFIPVAEESGLILPLGDWVLRRTLRDARAWRERGLPALRFAINVSVSQLRQADFPARLQTLIEAAGETGNGIRLAIEVTESVLIENLEQVVQSLRQIRALGVDIYLDDFGTGYSSLSYLNRLPVSCIKLDRSFISLLPDSEQSASLVRAAISMAHGLGIGVVAEGMETARQCEFLRAQGCEKVQGFLFSKPVTLEELVLLQERVFSCG